MDPRLRDIVEKVNALVVIGSAVRPLDRTAILQEMIVARGLADAFDERDLEEAVLAVGGSPDVVAGWLEGLASWM